MTLAQDVDCLLRDFGVPRDHHSHGSRTVRSPLNGEIIANVQDTSSDSVTEAIVRAKTAFLEWRSIPAPRRGELVRILGDELRSAKVALGRLVTIEAGKILSEGQGEVQEMIDICDFAVGLSRQLYGLIIASERPNHRMMEQWHPLGPVGVITSFNFPVAVWSWNAALALVCGDPVIWKPSEKTPLTALAVQALFERAAADFNLALRAIAFAAIGTAGRRRGLTAYRPAFRQCWSADGKSARYWSRTHAYRLSLRPAQRPWAERLRLVWPNALRGLFWNLAATTRRSCVRRRILTSPFAPSPSPPSARPVSVALPSAGCSFIAPFMMRSSPD